MRTVLIVQARMGSTRLPGKVMLPLGGAPMLQRLLERMAEVHAADEVVVAISWAQGDDVLAQFCTSWGVRCFRGSEADVLARYEGAARETSADLVIRVTADCPLLDPILVDRMVDFHRSGGFDFSSNMLPPTWPYGMAVEVMSGSALIEAASEARDPSEREHVTPFIYRRPERYKVGNLPAATDLSGHRWTVDVPEDYELVRLLFEEVQPLHPGFTIEQLVEVSERHPDWREINAAIQQNQLGRIELSRVTREGVDGISD